MNSPNRRFPWVEFAGCVGLAGLTILFLALSWRKWPDPLVDFGKELYIPWRLAHGAVLYRDVGEFYGPLSKYWNAGLFALFGPGMMILVAANLVVFACILAALYVLFRRAWGAGAAVLSSAVFISVFGFSQQVFLGNYNYATPYSHEVTHGLLICLALVLVLSRWIDKPALPTSGLAGGLFGLTLLLKPEVILPAALVTAAALALRWNSRRPFPFPAAAIWAGCAALPSLAFALYFSRHVAWSDAWQSACRAWLSVATDDVTSNLNQKVFLGFNHWKRNLALHGVATFSALLTVAAIGAAARTAEKADNRGRRLAVSGLLLGAVGALAWGEIPWLEVGRCFLGLTLIYLLACAVQLRRNSNSGVSDPVPARRFLLAVLAAGLMARMVLNGRIYQYGFFQASLAGVLLSAVVVFEAPARLAPGRFGRGLIAIASLLLLVCGVANLCRRSYEGLSEKTYAIGSGADLFYAFSPDIDQKTPIIRAIEERLSQSPPGQTLLVLPEGQMINYQARMPSPLGPAFFFGATLSHGREEALVAQLRAHPPDWVVLISRDLREYGIERYGEATGQGLNLLTWVLVNYRQELSWGGDPLDVQQTGGVLLRLAR